MSNVDSPKHYNTHPSGVECIVVVEHFGFNLGNVIKYLWRAEEKGAPMEDLEKARWYLDREIQKRYKEMKNGEEQEAPQSLPAQTQPSTD